MTAWKSVFFVIYSPLMYSVRREEGGQMPSFFRQNICSRLKLNERKSPKADVLKVRLGLSANKTWEKACKCTLFLSKLPSFCFVGHFSFGRQTRIGAPNEEFLRKNGRRLIYFLWKFVYVACVAYFCSGFQWKISNPGSKTIQHQRNESKRNHQRILPISRFRLSKQHRKLALQGRSPCCDRLLRHLVRPLQSHGTASRAHRRRI